MNYIKQLNAFYDWLLVNPISAKEQALYLAILHLNNKAGWKREFTIANQTLQALCSMSKSELHKVRNQLEQKGLIEYKRGKKGESGKYKIGFLYETNMDTNLETNMDTNLETNMEDINKHKQNKTKQKEEDEEDKGARPNPFAYYEQNGFGLISPVVADEISQWIDSGSFDEPEEIIILAMKEAVIRNVRSWKYVRKILMDWSSASLRTVNDVKAYQAEWEAKKQRSGPRRRTVAESREAAAELTQQRVLDAIASMWHSGMSAESIAEQLKRDPNEILLALVHLAKENKVKRRIGERK